MTPLLIRAKALSLSSCLFLGLFFGLSELHLHSQSVSFQPQQATVAPGTIDAPIEVLTSPQDASSVALAWQAATGRRLAFTQSFAPLNLTRGVYTSSEYVQLVLAALETQSLEIYHVTDTLDYVRPIRAPGPQQSSTVLANVRTPFVAPSIADRVLDEEGNFIEQKTNNHAKEIRELDVIAIDAEIGAVTLGNTHSAGLDILAALDDFKSSNVTGGTGGWFLGKNQSSNSSGPYLSSAAQPLSRYVQLLDQDSDYHSVSRPKMQCMSGQTAMISTGSRVAVPSSTLTTNFGGPSTSSNISYQNIALSLEVTPTLLSSGRIALAIKQTDNSISGTQVISGNSVPTIASQTFSTFTVVESGQLIALGGIRINRTTETRKGPKGLARLPLIGRLFRVDGANSTNSELLILLTARLATKQALAPAASRSETPKFKRKS